MRAGGAVPHRALRQRGRGPENEGEGELAGRFSFAGEDDPEDPDVQSLTEGSDLFEGDEDRFNFDRADLKSDDAGVGSFEKGDLLADGFEGGGYLD